MSDGARALIGCCLTRNQIFKKERVKAFKHSHPSTMKFDPDTGKPLWEDASFCILMPRDPDYVDGVDLSEVKPRPELGGLYLFHDRSGWGEEETRYLLGGLAVDDSDYSRAGNFRPMMKDAEIDSIREIREAVRKVLQPHGLWDAPVKFGLWAVHYNAI